jgi:hypothetical protein
MLFSAQINRQTVIAMGCPLRENENENDRRRLLQQTMRSIQLLPDLPHDQAPLTVEILESRGLTLEEHLFLNNVLFGKKHKAFVNSKLASRPDRKLPQVELLDSDHLIQRIRDRFLNSASQTPYPDGVLDVAVCVFDGESAHTINMVSYDPTVKKFVYWEPWPKGTFLAKSFNRAGIDAQPYDISKKRYCITEDELKKVIYYILIESEKEKESLGDPFE